MCHTDVIGFLFYGQHGVPNGGCRGNPIRDFLYVCKECATLQRRQFITFTTLAFYFYRVGNGYEKEIAGENGVFPYNESAQ